MHPRLRSRHASTLLGDEDAAVVELSRHLAQDGTSAILFFCSSGYDLARLGAALTRTFTVPVVGCTSAGQIGPGGFQQGGITAVSLASPELTVRSYPIRPLADCQAQAAAVADRVHADRARDPAGSRAFGLVLVDGLSLAEERLAAALYHSLADVPLIGGSAGDDLAFVRTAVYIDGAFASDAALLTVFSTTLPFATFKLQHFVPTAQRVVVTAADPARRLIIELNGEPAARAYAELIGTRADQLDARAFSKRPVMLRLGNELYIRAIQRVNPDLSLTLYCAIEEGLVLTLGRSVDPLDVVAQAFAAARARVGPPEVVIGCDCVLRRLELEADGLDGSVGAVLGDNRVVGFSTYGETWNALHVNQTFTGVAIGR